MGYVAPTWQNGGPPALNAKNMQDISDNLAYVSNNMVNPNLLDNWYFGNPVNQRGQASYTDGEYGIDRFTFDGQGGIMTVGDGFVSFQKTGDYTSPIQLFEPNRVPANQTVTISAIVNDDLFFATGTLESNVPVSCPGGRVEAYRLDNRSVFRFVFTGSGVYKVKAIKLELGTQQTLAHQENGVWVLNEIPDYGEQLRKCQRYYFKTASAQYSAYMMRKNTDDYLMDSCIFPVTMRTTPSVQLVSYRNPSTGAVITAEGNASQTTPDGFCIVNDAGKFAGSSIFQVAFSATADL